MTVTRIGHIAFVVKDLDEAATFAQDVIGLREVERTDDVAYLTSNTRHHQLRLRAGDAHACEEIAFDVHEPGDLDELRGRATDAGLEVLDGVDDPHLPDAIRVVLPDGPILAFCHGTTSLPPLRYSVLGARPRKLGHVTISSPSCAAVKEALVEVLGFRLSDRLPLGEQAAGDLTWYRCNSDHHALGLTPGEPGVHHYAFELDGFGAYGVMGDHLLARDIRYIWGPGRHGPGDNLFAYYPDSEGSMVEIYADMLQVENEASYEMADWPDLESSANIWGPAPPDVWFSYATPFVPAADRVPS